MRRFRRQFSPPANPLVQDRRDGCDSRRNGGWRRPRPPALPRLRSAGPWTQGSGSRGEASHKTGAGGVPLALATLAQGSTPAVRPARWEVRQSGEEREGSDDQGAEREVRPGPDGHRGGVLEAQRGDRHPAPEEVPRLGRRLQGPEEHPGQTRREGHAGRGGERRLHGPGGDRVGYDDVVVPAKSSRSSSRIWRPSRSGAPSSRGRRSTRRAWLRWRSCRGCRNSGREFSGCSTSRRASSPARWPSQGAARPPDQGQGRGFGEQIHSSDKFSKPFTGNDSAAGSQVPLRG